MSEQKDRMMTFREKGEKKADVLPKFRKAILEMNAAPKPQGVDDSAQVALSKFRVLDKMMAEVVSLIRVHCADTAKMTASIWETNKKIFIASNNSMRQVFAENQRFQKSSKILQQEKEKIVNHSKATITRLDDRVVLLQADLCDAIVKAKVAESSKKETEKERERLRKIVNGEHVRKGDAESSRTMADRFEHTFERLDFESRKQMKLLLDLEDEFTSCP